MLPIPAASDQFPLVAWLANVLSNTLTIVAITLFTAALIIIVIGLVASHITDRESSRWWKALVVWIVAIALFGASAALIAWIQAGAKANTSEPPAYSISVMRV